MNIEIPLLALRWLLDAVSRDETRTHLHGVNVDSTGLTATDGHRVHHWPVASPDAPVTTTIAAPALLTLARGGKAKDTVRIVVEHAGNAYAERAGVRVSLSQITDRFPPWRQAAGKRPERVVRLDVTYLEQALAHAKASGGNAVDVFVSAEDDVCQPVWVESESKALAVVMQRRRD